MTVLVLIRCDFRGLECSEREHVLATDAATARTKAARWGWATTTRNGRTYDLCRIHARYPRDLDEPPPTTGSIPAVRLLEKDVPRSTRCEDGDHHLCHDATCRDTCHERTPL